VSHIVESAANQLRVAKRLTLRKGGSIGERIGRHDDRLVFVVGSPRSGTTFLADAIGSLPGFVDLGEVAPVKAAVPELVLLEPMRAARRLRRILTVARYLGLVGAVRPVEQTPEVAYLVDVVRLAYPQARIVHVIRDGRDVVSSLLEKRWLSSGLVGKDDAGIAYGSYARFWVEPERRSEFPAVSDARRAAWAWRRYVGAARGATTLCFEVRYERMATDPGGVALELAAHLGTSGPALAESLRQAHSTSIGRYRRDLRSDDLADVVAEAGDLLLELGYLESKPSTPAR
jgi:hypothetical protein